MENSQAESPSSSNQTVHPNPRVSEAQPVSCCQKTKLFYLKKYILKLSLFKKSSDLRIKDVLTLSQFKKNILLIFCKQDTIKYRVFMLQDFFEKIFLFGLIFA